LKPFPIFLISFIYEKTVFFYQSDDELLTLGIDSVVAIPLEDWSLDLVTPSTECIRKDGACIIPGFPDAPDQVYFSPTSIKEHLLTTPQGKFCY
jgi:hypothetical protein